MMKSRCIYLAVLAISISAGRLSAQQTNGRNAVETAFFRAVSPMIGSAIPSLAGFAGDLAYSDISCNGEAEGGSLHRPQEAETRYLLGFDASGARRLGKFFLDGDFSFGQSFENGIGFASTFDSFRGNPYFIADSTGGDWKKQSYRLRADVAYTLVPDKISIGLGMGIEVGRGAKDIDPRPQANSNDLVFKPCLSYDTGHLGIFSAALSGSLHKETSNLILYDTSFPQKLYLMKGLGQYTYEVFSTTERERKFDGNSIGAALGYYLNSGNNILTVDAGWQNGYEETFDIDNSKPHMRGILFSDSFDVDAELKVIRARAFRAVSLSFSDVSRSGHEIVQRFDPAPEVNSWVTEDEIPGRWLNSEQKTSLGYDFWLHDRLGRTLCRAELTGGYAKTSERYPAMESHMEYCAFTAGAAGTGIIYFGEKGAGVSIGGEFAARICTSSSMAVTSREEDRTIADGLIGPDFNYLSSDLLSGGISVGPFFRLRSGRYLGLMAKCRRAFVSDSAASRNFASLRISYTF